VFIGWSQIRLKGVEGELNHLNAFSIAKNIINISMNYYYIIPRVYLISGLISGLKYQSKI